MSSQYIHGAGFSGVGNTVRGWYSALRGIRTNPLVAYWSRAERRRLEQKHWFRRSPGLLIIAALLTLPVTAYLIFLIMRLLGDEAGLLASLQGRTWLVAATSMVLYGLGLFSLCWLTARVFTATRLALGFLELNPRQHFREVLDDMLATTSLSPQEVLIAVASMYIRQVLPPVILLSAAVTGVFLQFGLYSGEPLLQSFPLHGYHVFQTRDVIWTAAGMFAKPVLGGCLAALIVCFTSITLGMLPRSGVMPSVGAGILAALTLPFSLVGAILCGMTVDGLNYLVYEAAYVVLLAMVCCLLLALVYYLARRLPWLQKAFGFGWPLIALAIAVVALSPVIIDSGPLDILFGMETELAWFVSHLALYNPFHLVPDLWLFRLGADGPLTEWWRFPFGLIVQLIMLITMAEYARDSVRRRFQGVSGT